jgi:hypothetical protein
MNNFICYPFLPPNCEKPPTVYSILNSIVNSTKEPNEYTKIKDLAKEGRSTIFDFDYPLSSNVSSETFETMILNHYMMRRIGFDTVTAFKLQLNVKLNEIMPIYNKMFDSLENWDIFNDGEKQIRSGFDNRDSNSKSENINNLENNSNTNTTTTSDNRSSDTPQNQLEDVKNGNYVTQYSYDTNINSGTDNSTSVGNSKTNSNTSEKNNYEETITRTPADKISILKDMQTNIKNIYTMIFDELDVLFYGII